jgi:hypothetical protein
LDTLARKNLQHLIIRNEDFIIFQTADANKHELEEYQRKQFFYLKDSKLEKELLQTKRDSCSNLYCKKIAHKKCINKMCKSCCQNTLKCVKACNVHKTKIAQPQPQSMLKHPVQKGAMELKRKKRKCKSTNTRLLKKKKLDASSSKTSHAVLSFEEFKQLQTVRSKLRA